MKASVVICAHTEDRWDDLRAAVASVRSQSHPAHELIVVIDHNAALLERALAALDGVLVVPNQEPKGLGGARNSGVTAASGDVVAFLDDDAVASPEWLQHFAAGYDSPSVAGVGGGIEPAWEAGRPAWFPREFDWTVGCTYLGMPADAQPVRNLIGCNMSYRRDALEEAGRFRLGYGCDETEFCIRLTRTRPGSILLYVPQAQVRHRVPADRGTLRYFVGRCFFEGGSKAVVSRLTGAGAGLEAERAYTLRVLPAGIRAGVVDFVARRDIAGVQRAAAIVAGLAATVAGYAAAAVQLRRSAERRGWAGERLTWRGAVAPWLHRAGRRATP